MSCFSGPEITNNNLILCYDMLNTQKSFLGEPTTNLVTAPEDFNDATWGKQNFSVTQNATLAPNDTLTADLITSTTNDPYLNYTVNVTAGVTYTWSFHVKGNNCVGKYGLIWVWYFGTATGPAAATSYTITQDWQRASVTVTPTGSGTVVFRIDFIEPAVTGDSVYVWGAQLETKSYATPYVSTSRANTQTLIDLTNTKTITANNLTYSSNNTFSFNGSNNHIWIGDLGTFPSTGTIDFWMNSSEVVNYRNPFHTNYTGTGNSVGIRFEQYTGGGFNVVVGNDAATYAGGIITSSLQANTWYNVVVTWNTSTNTLTGYLNSVRTFTTSHTYWATTLSKVAVGVGYDSNRYFKGSIPKINIYNTALSASEIQQNFNALRSRFGL